MAITFGTNTLVTHLSAIQWPFDAVNYHVALHLPPRCSSFGARGDDKVNQEAAILHQLEGHGAGRGGSHSRLGSKTLRGACPSKGLEKCPGAHEPALVWFLSWAYTSSNLLWAGGCTRPPSDHQVGVARPQQRAGTRSGAKRLLKTLKLLRSQLPSLPGHFWKSPLIFN